MSENTLHSNEQHGDSNASPVYVEGRCLYVSANEWNRLCELEGTAPLASVLKDGRAILGKGGAMRLLSAMNEVHLSADSLGELQRVIDDANSRRSELKLAPVILTD